MLLVLTVALPVALAQAPRNTPDDALAAGLPATAAATTSDCRDEATLVGPGGATRDSRLYQACVMARGLVQEGAAPSWTWPPGGEGSVATGERWLDCLHGATYQDASGWPRIQPRLAEACMADAGWVRVEPAGARPARIARAGATSPTEAPSRERAAAAR